MVTGKFCLDFSVILRKDGERLYCMFPIIEVKQSDNKVPILLIENLTVNFYSLSLSLRI